MRGDGKTLGIKKAQDTIFIAGTTIPASHRGSKENNMKRERRDQDKTDK
jgi:hypothetical protein